jgi:hypothetical protein
MPKNAMNYNHQTTSDVDVPPTTNYPDFNPM